MSPAPGGSGEAVAVARTRACIVPGCQNPATGLQCEEHQAAARGEPSRLMPWTPERTHSDDPTEAGVLEATRQAAGIDAMERVGWTVWRVGQRDARGTQDPGVGDTWCVHEARRLAVWVEWKRPEGGVLSESQAEFRRLCLLAGVPHVVASQVEHVATLHLTLTPLPRAG